MANDENDLMDIFADVARSLAGMEDAQTTLQKIVDIAVAIVPGADQAAVSLIVRRRDVTTPASTGQVAEAIDAAQYETGEGPCLDAIWDQEVVQIDDLADDARWPHFRSRPVELGIRSMMCFRLFVEDDTAGALNLYGAEPSAFTEESRRIGHVLAAHAAVALDHAQEVEGLERAVRTREIIGQAQGILMERLKVTPSGAFDVLRIASQTRNVKLREVADHVVETGELPNP